MYIFFKFNFTTIPYVIYAVCEVGSQYRLVSLSTSGKDNVSLKTNLVLLLKHPNYLDIGPERGNKSFK